MAGAHHAAALGQAADPLLVLEHQGEANYPAHIGGQDQEQEQDRNRSPIAAVPWLTILGFCFLTFNSAMAVHRSRGDVRTVAFVAFSYGDLVALFVCLRRYELAPVGSPARDRLKVAVWLLTALLTFAFSYKVAAVMPPPVAVVVWLMAFATVAGGFLAFFVYTGNK